MTLSNRHSPDLQLYTNNLPRCHRNHLPGYQTTLQVICPSLDEAQILPPNASDSWPSWCRWGSDQVAMYVSEAVASSTSKEAHDHRTYRQHGALTAYLPEVPCSPQPHHDGRSFAAVRGTSASPTKSNHWGAQQNTGAHHAEVWEVRTCTSLSPPAPVPSTPTSTHTQLQLQNYCLWESGWCWNCWIASWRKGSAWIMKCKVWKTIVVFADRCPPTLAEISLLLQLPTPHSSLWLVACLKVHFPGCRCRPHSCCHCRSQSRTSTCFYSLFFFPQPWPSECQNVYTPSVHHITAHI